MKEDGATESQVKEYMFVPSVNLPEDMDSTMDESQLNDDEPSTLAEPQQEEEEPQSADKGVLSWSLGCARSERFWLLVGGSSE